MLRDLIVKNRTYRRFYEDHALNLDVLRELVDLARLSSSGANLQPLKYLLSNDKARNGKIFATLGWAGYLKDWDGPVEGERPSGYIVILHDRSISKKLFWDHGLAAQSILLGAVELGLGGCMFDNVNRNELRAALGIAETYDILMVIALGRPKETVQLVPLAQNGSVKYYRDAEGVHYVPKRALDDIILP